MFIVTSILLSLNTRHWRQLDDTRGYPVSVSLMALQSAAIKAEFGFVRDHVEVSDSVLSKQISDLEQAGYVKVHKGFVGKWPRTWLSFTKNGRRAFERNLAALREIASVDWLEPAGGQR